jgi:hypothetical protein
MNANEISPKANLLIVYFIAWFFREAQKLQEEQELTV